MYSFFLFALPIYSRSPSTCDVNVNATAFRARVLSRPAGRKCPHFVTSATASNPTSTAPSKSPAATAARISSPKTTRSNSPPSKTWSIPWSPTTSASLIVNRVRSAPKGDDVTAHQWTSEDATSCVVEEGTTKCWRRSARIAGVGFTGAASSTAKRVV